MEAIPSSLAGIIRDFFHVEWFELKELRALVSNGAARFDVELFRRELSECIMSYPAIPVVEINGLSGNEFETQEEVRRWLAEIRQGVFGV